MLTAQFPKGIRTLERALHDRRQMYAINDWFGFRPREGDV